MDSTHIKKTDRLHCRCHFYDRLLSAHCFQCQQRPVPNSCSSKAEKFALTRPWVNVAM